MRAWPSADQRLLDLADHPVDRLHRLSPAPEHAVDPRDLSRSQRRPVGQPQRRARRQRVEARGPRGVEPREVVRVARSGHERIVGRERRELEIERLVRRRGGVDELNALGGDHVGEIVRRLVSVVLEGAVFVQRVVELGIAPAGHVPFAPARRDVGVGHGRGLHVAVQVLAHHRRLVAGALERGSERVLLLAAEVEQVKAAVRTRVLEDAGVVREVAGQDRRPRRAAQRVRDEVVVERETVALHRLHVRHVREQVHRQVVGEDEHDVRMPRAARCPPCVPARDGGGGRGDGADGPGRSQSGPGADDPRTRDRAPP